MTIGEAIQRVQSLYSKGVESDDTRLRSRHIYNKLLTARDFIIGQLNSLRSFYQTIYCVKVEKYSGCKCDTCDVWRAKVPDIVYKKGRPLIEYIKSKNGKQKILIQEQEGSIEGLKYGKMQTIAFYENGYIYFLNKIPPQELIVRAVFKDPVDLLKYSYECDDECLSAYELEFPTSDMYMEKIIELAVQELVRIFSTMREDQSSDSRDSINIK